MTRDRAGFVPQIIYLIYSVYEVAFGVLHGWPSWVPATIIFGVVTSFAYFIIMGDKDKGAKIYCTVMIWMNVFMYCIFNQSLATIWPSIATIVVMVSLFDLLFLNYMSIVVTFILIILNVFVLKTEDLSFRMQFLAIFLLEFIEIKELRDRIQSQKDLGKSMKEQKFAEQGKDDFMANISHEIRTPLNIMCGVNELLMQQDMGQEMHKAVYDSYVAGQNLRTLVADILDFTELQNDQMEMLEEPYDFSYVVNDTIAMVNSWIAGKDIDFVVDCQANIPNKLVGDSEKIYRILLHLLHNAVKFTDAGGVSLSIEAREESYGVNLLITVEDSGIGIEAEKMENLTKVYNQLDTTRARQNTGVGLGLAITKKLLDKMGGVLHMESRYGEGTRVIVTIPQKKLSNEPLVSVQDPEKINILYYVDLARFHSGMVRDAYLRAAQHVAEQFHIGIFRCNSQEELQRRVKEHTPSHIMVFYEEYVMAKDYYNAIAEYCTVMMICKEDTDLREVNEKIRIVYAPFHIFNLAALLNKQDLKQIGLERWRRQRQFTVRGANILVVDDSPINLNVVGSLMKRYGVTIDRAESGREALDKIMLKRYDLVFMDHMMPEMDGVECLHHIRSMPGSFIRSIPVVALTANAVSGAREMFLREGFDDFVAKPIEKSNLERVLRKFLSDFVVEGENEEDEFKYMAEGSAPELRQLTPSYIDVQLAEEEEPQRTAVSIPTLEGFNWEAALHVLQTEDLLMETLEFFHGSFDKIADHLNSFFDAAVQTDSEAEREKQIRSYKIEVHALKSSAATVGALHLSDSAKNLEGLANQNDLEQMKIYHPMLMTEIAVHKERIATILPKSEEADRELVAVDEKEYRAALDQLDEALDDCDFNETSIILNKLKGYQMYEQEKELIDLIEKDVQTLDFDSAVQHVEILKEKKWQADGTEI